MNRRKFLRVLAAVPLPGTLFGSITAAKPSPDPRYLTIGGNKYRIPSVP